MSKPSELRELFRAINEALTNLETQPIAEMKKTLKALKEINETLCDNVIDLVKEYEKIKQHEPSINI